EDDFLYINNDRNGAIVMLRGVTTPEAERIAAGLAVFYSKLRDQGNANVMRWRIGREAVDQDIDQTIRPSQAVDPDTAREMEKSILAAAKN
ncbi:MAG: hypothetical protein LIP23_08650, partial [Planctomycetes bacterium]|nr:hypothetical protein [Planctomycetota bacterium]